MIELVKFCLYCKLEVKNSVLDFHELCEAAVKEFNANLPKIEFVCSENDLPDELRAADCIREETCVFCECTHHFTENDVFTSWGMAYPSFISTDNTEGVFFYTEEQQVNRIICEDCDIDVWYKMSTVKYFVGKNKKVELKFDRNNSIGLFDDFYENSGNIQEYGYLVEQIAFDNQIPDDYSIIYTEDSRHYYYKGIEDFERFCKDNEIPYISFEAISDYRFIIPSNLYELFEKFFDLTSYPR